MYVSRDILACFFQVVTIFFSVPVGIIAGFTNVETLRYKNKSIHI
jgi:hypothetical protein